MMRKLFFVLSFLFATGSFLNAQHIGSDCLEVTLPNVIVSDVKQSIQLKIISTDSFGQLEGVEKTVIFNGRPILLTFNRNKAEIFHDFPDEEQLTISVDDFQWTKLVRPIPLWMSVLPPLVAILMALILKEVFTALFVGILVGTTIIYYYKGFGIFLAVSKGLLAIIDTYVMESLLDRGHLSIIVFSMVIGGMVQLITRNGGMKGVVNRLSVFATTARSGQFVTWFLGVIIFFDDYANTLVVGNTMRPVTDRLKISREKLSYLVDSTAAPVAAIAFVTTWIGAELSYIQDGLNTIGLEQSAYTVFFNSLAYSFYPLLTLIFMLMLIWQQRDFGPMFKAETLARNIDDDSNKISDSGGSNKDAVVDFDEIKHPRAFNAVIPVMVIVFGTLAGLLYTGWDQSVWDKTDMAFTTKVSAIIGNSDSYAALLWSSISALIVALALTLSQRLLKLNEAVESVVDGFRTMLTAILILTLAWSVALVTQHMHTADFISAGLLKLSFSPYFVPAFTFILASLVAFSTGSSWGTMAILYPLILPTSWLLTSNHGMDHEHAMIIFYSVVSAVLSGSILGDHCSPISDTTILSSISSGCNHIDHVRTQLPYALTVGLVAVVFGTIPAAFGIPSWILLLVSTIILYFVIRFFGKKVILPQDV